MEIKFLIIATIILAIQSFAALGQECVRLSDGQYLFELNLKEYRQADFTLKVQGDTFSIIRHGQEQSKGQIDWYSDNCMFQLRSDEREVSADSDSLNNVQKVLPTLGDSCYEIVNRVKFRLTYCGNLHLTKAEGQITKSKK